MGYAIFTIIFWGAYFIIRSLRNDHTGVVRSGYITILVFLTPIFIGAAVGEYISWAIGAAMMAAVLFFMVRGIYKFELEDAARREKELEKRREQYDAIMATPVPTNEEIEYYRKRSRFNGKLIDISDRTIRFCLRRAMVQYGDVASYREVVDRIEQEKKWFIDYMSLD